MKGENSLKQEVYCQTISWFSIEIGSLKQSPKTYHKDSAFEVPILLHFLGVCSEKWALGCSCYFYNNLIFSDLCHKKQD